MGASITSAMRSFAAWATSRPYRLVPLAVICAHLLAPVSIALLVVDALRRGPMAAVGSALATIAGLVALALVLGADLTASLSLTAPLVLGGAVCGTLLNRARSLSLAFQGTILVVIVGTAIVFAIVPEAIRIGDILRSQLMALFEFAGASADQLAQYSAVDTIEFARVFSISLLTSLLASLVLGLWWYSLIEPGVDFGTEFRALKLGRVAGIALMVLIVAGQLTRAVPIQNVAPMAVIGFLFQGLAVLHARSHRDKWPRAVMIVVYVGLISPLRFAVLMAVSAVGLLDNFFDLRAQLRPKA